MTLDERKILAVTESMLVWDRIASIGGTKCEAIDALAESGLLGFHVYDYNCPLCEEFRHNEDSEVDWWEDEDQCTNCPWPGEGQCRCCDEGSPFREWDNADSDDEAMAAAGKVFKLLHTMPL